MHIVILTIKRHKLGFKLVAHISKDNFKVIKSLFGENCPSILSDKEQLHMQIKDNVSTTS